MFVRGSGEEHTPIEADETVDISPSTRFCISEEEIVITLYKRIKLLKNEEDKCNIWYQFNWKFIQKFLFYKYD